MKIRIIHILNKNEDSERLAIIATDEECSAEDFLMLDEFVESDTIFECKENVTLPIGYEWIKN